MMCMRKKAKNVIFIITILIITLICFPFILYAIDPVQGYANGNSITIAQDAYNWPSLANIYGGTSSETIDNTDMTIGITNNTFTNIFGGSQTGIINGKSKITYNANNNIDFTTDTSGYSAYHLYGGNANGGTIQNTEVEINSGWIRGWIVAGSTAGTITGDSVVNIKSGLVGSPVDGYSSGQGEVYGGPGGTGVLEGNTYVNISGNKFVPDNYRPGDNVTIIRQHVLGGPFTSGTVEGNTNVMISGSSILGQVNGGGGGRWCC